MKLVAVVALASCALAAPVAKPAITDVDILQYALTLEHLENDFYRGALRRFSKSDFQRAGFSGRYYENLQFIAKDEQSHVELLTGALSGAGVKPVEPCTYSFPYKDVRSFVGLSAVLEGVGTSAYLGGAGFIESKDYLTVAGSILVTEALHTSLQRFSLGQIAAANPYGTPLGLNEVFTLAAAFIKSCPKTNPALPVKAFPALTAAGGQRMTPGTSFRFTTKDQQKGKLFVTFVSGLSVTSVPAVVRGKEIHANIPKTAMGQTYAILTNKEVTKLTDDVVVAGPAILEVPPPSPTGGSRGGY